MTRFRTFLLLPLLLLGVLVPVARPDAQVLDPVRYAIVKSGYVLNLLRLSQWPDEAFDSEQSALVVQVVGEDDMTPFLRELLREERIGERAVVVRQAPFPRPQPAGLQADPESWERFSSDLRNAHLLYVANSERFRLDEILEVVADAPVLTVSDINGFANEHGGMVAFAVREGRVAIEANLPRIEESGVVVSSRVLQLATIVSD